MFGIWLPWYVWVVFGIFLVPLYLIWACIAAVTFVIVTAIAWPIRHSFRDGAQTGATTFAWMIVPGHMARQHNARLAH